VVLCLLVVTAAVVGGVGAGAADEGVDAQASSATVEAVEAQSRASTGDTVPVGVTVTNNGTASATIDVTIEVRTDAGEAVASTTGRISLSSGETGTLDDSLDTSGIAPGEYDLVVEAGTDAATRSLSVASADGFLRGTVRDTEATPVANATLVVTAPGYERTIPNATDVDGEFTVSVPGLGPGAPYDVEVRRPGYRPTVAGSVVVGPAETTRVDATLVSVDVATAVEVEPESRTVTVGETVSFTATVYNASTPPRRPLPGRQVALTSTDPDVRIVGESTRRTEVDGTVTFRVTADRPDLASLEFLVIDGTQPTAAASITFERAIPDPGTLGGTVTDGTSTPVEDADLVVAAPAEGYRRTVANATGPDGQFGVEVPGYGPDATYTVTVRKTGYTLATTSGLVVRPDQFTGFDATIAPVADGRVRGVATDRSGTPVPDATVRLSARGYNRTYVATAGPDGAFALGVPGYGDAAPYAVTVSKPGFEQFTADVNVTPDGTTRVDATLASPAEGILSGRLVNESGIGVEGATVVVSSTGSARTYETTTGPNGDYDLQLPGFGDAQPYRLSVEAAGYRSVDRTVAVDPGGVTVVDPRLRRPADGTLLVTVAGTRGQLVPNISVRATAERFAGSDADRTGLGGVVSLEVPGYGTETSYRVTASGSGYVTARTTATVRPNATTRTEVVVVAEGENPFPFGVPGVSGDTPTTVDDDPEYEDVDGSGSFEFADVVALLFADLDAINRNPARRDALDHDGSGRVGFGDVVALLFEL
jgi:hypothetical protein